MRRRLLRAEDLDSAPFAPRNPLPAEAEAEEVEALAAAAEEDLLLLPLRWDLLSREDDLRSPSALRERLEPDLREEERLEDDLPSRDLPSPLLRERLERDLLSERREVLLSRSAPPTLARRRLEARAAFWMLGADMLVACAPPRAPLSEATVPLQATRNS